jgi:acyl phosphate:glycerol-3-phosphate acyltransferase
VIASFRFVSLASLCATLGLPLAVFLLGYPWPIVLAAVGVVGIVVGRHRENIERLLQGTERRLGQREQARA